MHVHAQTVHTAPTGRQDGRQVGIVGLGPIGSNLAQNITGLGHRVVLHNRTVTRAVEVASRIGDRAAVAASYRELASALERPRSIVVLVAPAATGKVISDLTAWLEPGDVVIDGGNSAFEDTEARQRKLRGGGLRLLGAGVASGVDGARDGLSATIGGDPDGCRQVRWLLDGIGARVDGESCCVHVGDGGSGHFVKMVHNGVEYTVMQLLAEVVTLLRAATGRPPAELAGVLSGWNEALDSYIVRVTVDVLDRTDEQTGRPFLDVVADRAIQHGSGRRAAQSALQLGVAAPAFAESSLAWFLSCDQEQRCAATRRGGSRPGIAFGAEPDLVDWARHALRAAMLVTCAQAFRHIVVAGRHYGWNLDTGSVVRSWRGACIRSSFLQEIHQSCRREPALPTVVDEDFFVAELAESDTGWRNAVHAAMELGVAVPCLSSTVAWADGLRAVRSSGAVIQALRSRLGGNPYERIDAPGAFRATWPQEQA